MSQPMTIEEYSEKAFVVRGDTKPHKDALSSRRGRYNPNLRGGGGWIFSKRHLQNIQAYISENSEPSTTESPDPSRKRKSVDLNYYKKKLRKTIKEEVRAEVEREFAYQKPFVMDQWCLEFAIEEKYAPVSTQLRKTSVCNTLKQILILFIFALVIFHIGQKGTDGYVSIGWEDQTCEGCLCQCNGDSMLFL